jgi:UDP-N-acetylmuramoylalanine--D-glutamate ligase
MPLDVAGRRVLVVGMGVSGSAVATFLSGRGAAVTVTDRAAVPDAADGIPALEAGGVRFELGGHHPESFSRADMIVVSPGVPHTMPLIRAAAVGGVPVMGELELASRFIESPLIAVTGTNGKTTTTSLLAHLISGAGFRVVVGGNIGTPLAALADASKSADVTVVEVSSFQLDTIDTFRPDISVILNITPDHLDRYEGLSAYADSKGRILENQRPSDVAVLNGNDPEIRRISSGADVGKCFFHAAAEETGGVFDNDLFLLRGGTHDGISLDLSCLRQPGRHNRENAAAAALAALAFGVGPDDIQAGLAGFEGLAHRIAPVAAKGGVRFFNDSKATNIDAVAKALEAFEAPVVLIMGGRNKGYRFSVLADAVREHVRELLVIGESAPEIMDDLGQVVPSRVCSDMTEAVRMAATLASPGDVVLLSPGCASFDMYKNYKDRGDAFCKAVASI